MNLFTVNFSSFVCQFTPDVGNLSCNFERYMVFHFYRAMLCIARTSPCRRKMSVRPSVTPPPILSKRLNNKLFPPSGSHTILVFKRLTLL